MIDKPDFCKGCPINHATTGYVPPLLVDGSTELWIGEAAGDEESKQGKPFVGGAGSWLDSLCRSAKLDRTKISIVNTIGCRPPDNIYPTDAKWHATSRDDGRRAVEYCRQHHLRPAIQAKQWSRIVALGDQALRATTNREGILIWRGAALPLKGGDSKPKVLPTLHPAYLMRQAGMFPVVVGDLKRNLILPPENYNLYARDAQQHEGKVVSFDFEWDRDGNITICGLSSELFGADVYSWNNNNVQKLKEIFESSPGFIGHNIIGADIGYIEKLGWNVDWDNAELWDTMLMQHLVQPDYRHSLGFVASVFTKKVFWKGSGKWEEEDEDGNKVGGGGAQWLTWNRADAIAKENGGYGGCASAEEAFRLYNARDADAAFQIAQPLKQKLEQYGLMNVYENVSIPTAFICRSIADAGIKIDHSRLKGIREVIDAELNTLDARLPDGLRSYEVEVTKNVKAPAETYKPKTVRCRGAKGSKHEPREFVFLGPTQRAECECGKVLVPGKMHQLKTVKVAARERIVPWNSTQQTLRYAASVGAKEVVNRKTGRVTGNKNARKHWQKQHPEFIIVDALKKNVTLRNNFAKDALFGVDRMYFNLLVHGTAEGRLSSSGKRDGIDLNIQNQPKKIRRIFVPDYPNWGILNPDFIQGENMITAWLAKDWPRWKRLHEKDYNEHLDFGERLFGQRLSKTIRGDDGKDIDNPLYVCAKRINHGRNYGMGVRKQQETLAAEGFNYSESDIKEFIKIWRIMMARTARWQDETIALAGKQSYLRNAFGRARWFMSRDYATKALAFLPASTLADICLRCMIALNLDIPRCAKSAANLGIQAIYQLPRPWRLMAQVHDSLPAQGPHANHEEVAWGMKKVLEQPWAELDGFSLGVDFGYSQSSWGECKELKI